MRSKIVIIHHNDNDGYFSAAVVGQYHKSIKPFSSVEFVAWNYGAPIPTVSEDTDFVYLVDLSFPLAAMEELKSVFGDRFIWIDHHKSAINELEHLELPGLRNANTAACELCWEYLYGDTPKPLLLEYVGAYDIWNKTKFAWDDVLAVKYWVEAAIKNNPKNIKFDVNIEDAIKIGNYIRDYIDIKNKEACDTMMFEASIQGFNTICLNTNYRSSETFKSRFSYDNFDIMLIFFHNGKSANFSIYSTKPNVDCSVIAKSLGGGGHKGAAGFILDNTSFTNFLKEKSL